MDSQKLHQDQYRYGKILYGNLTSLVAKFKSENRKILFRIVI